MALLKRFAHLFIGQRRGGETTEQEENCFVCLFLSKNDLIVLINVCLPHCLATLVQTCLNFSGFAFPPV